MVLDSHSICIIGGNNTVNLDSSDEEDSNTDKSSHETDREETESSVSPTDKTPVIENTEASASKRETALSKCSKISNTFLFQIKCQ